MGLGMTKIVIDAHKCIDPKAWAFEYKDNLTLTMIADQISVLAGVKVMAVGWEDPGVMDLDCWCRFHAQFPTQESAMEFILKWQ